MVLFRAHLGADQLADLVVTVDLQTNTIIGIEAGPDSDSEVLDPVAGTPPLPPLAPDEGPDAVNPPDDW
jgi:hypothetical protein